MKFPALDLKATTPSNSRTVGVKVATAPPSESQSSSKRPSAVEARQELFACLRDTVLSKLYRNVNFPVSPTGVATSTPWLVTPPFIRERLSAMSRCRPYRSLRVILPSLCFSSRNFWDSRMEASDRRSMYHSTGCNSNSPASEPPWPKPGRPPQCLSRPGISIRRALATSTTTAAMLCLSTSVEATVPPEPSQRARSATEYTITTAPVTATHTRSTPVMTWRRRPGKPARACEGAASASSSSSAAASGSAPP
mmetsp:Transcript_4950/g.14024  ORF Transcript_4950/g.14024 Transcript_4950/m.14024 type:complete len:252 (-) Transcript_4950:78-833(-)